MIKKISVVIAISVCMFFTSNSVQASVSDLVNVKSFESIYKSSTEKDVRLLPFIKMFSDNAIYDTNLNSSGMSLSNKSITVDKNLKGEQILLVQDTVTINGTVEYAKIMASNVVINGTIKNDTVIMAQSVFITEKAVIENDLMIFAGVVEIRGNVKGSVIGSSNDLYVSGNIERDLRMNATTFKFENEKIKGNIFLGTDMDTTALKAKYPNAVIKSLQETKNQETKTQVSVSSIVMKGIIQVLLYTLIYMIITKKQNNFIDKLTNKVKDHITLSSLIGIAMIFSIPMIITLLLFSAMFGLGTFAWPSMIAYLAITILIFMTSQFIVGIVTNNFILDKVKDKVNTNIKKIGVTLGTFTIIYALSVIPHIENYASLLYILLASGIIFTGIFTKKKEVVIENQENKKEE